MIEPLTLKAEDASMLCFCSSFHLNGGVKGWTRGGVNWSLHAIRRSAATSRIFANLVGKLGFHARAVGTGLIPRPSEALRERLEMTTKGSWKKVAYLRND